MSWATSRSNEGYQVVLVVVVALVVVVVVATPPPPQQPQPPMVPSSVNESAGALGPDGAKLIGSNGM